jgi:hypothetical protein
MKATCVYGPSAFYAALILELLVAAHSALGNHLPPDKIAFLGLWKTSTGYGLDFSTNGSVKITEDYNWQKTPAWFTVFQHDWNADNVPVAGGTNFEATIWNVEFQDDDFLFINGGQANRRYKINIYPWTETNQTKMVLNGMEFTRMPREGLITPVPPSDPLDLPIHDKALAARIAGISRMTNQHALANIVCTDKVSAARRAALRKLSDPAALARVIAKAEASDVRWAAIYKVTDTNVLMKAACEYYGWDGYLNAAAVERLNDQAALAQLARAATNWPGLWTVRRHATSKLTNQAALASIACNEHEPQICRTAVHGLTNQELLIKVLLHGGDFPAVRKHAFNKLDPAHLSPLISQTRDPAEVIGAKIKLGQLTWDQVFGQESLKTNGLGNIVGAAAYVNRPKPETNAVRELCHRFLAQRTRTRTSELVDLLNRFGDQTMAGEFINSGDKELAFFGGKWANDH